MFSVLHSSDRQPVSQLPERFAPVRDAELFVLTDRSQRFPVGRVIEDWVVAKAVVALRRRSDLTLNRSSSVVDHGTRMDHGDGADEPRRARRGRALCEAPVNLRKALGIGRVWPQETRRIDAGLAVERVNDDAGVLGNRVNRTALHRGGRLRHGPVVCEGFDPRVFLEGRPGLVRFRHGRKIPKAEEVDWKMAEQAADFPQFVATRRRNEKAEQLLTLTFNF